MLRTALRACRARNPGLLNRNATTLAITSTGERPFTYLYLGVSNGLEGQVVERIEDSQVLVIVSITSRARLARGVQLEAINPYGAT